jgi:hypothetical protein
MPDSMHSIGKMLILTGIVVVAMGGLLMLVEKISWFGKLPGDIVIQRKNFTFYFPLAISILLSVILSLLFWIFGKR